MDAITARKLLRRERAELERVVRAERREVDDHDDEILDREADVTILQLAGERVAAVDHALRKLDAGTYGVCERCGDSIPDSRLRAYPDTRFCEADERAWERSTRVLPDDEEDPGWEALASMDEDDEVLVELVPMPAEEAAMHEEV